ncbi:MAG: 2-amino-4-hydroxy-6-hydroxymethyldihydropteridine diphosphokinase [Anaplasma sp.]
MGAAAEQQLPSSHFEKRIQMYVVLSLGSSLGARMGNLETAVRLLPLHGKICSYVYESAALLPAQAPVWWDTPYLNMVITGYVGLTPTGLLESAKGIETTLGRRSEGVWGPRSIDVDILLWEGLSMQSDTLIIPHKEMHKRDFVLVPMCDICPRFVHSTLQTTLESILLAMPVVNVDRKHPPITGV